MTAFRVLVGLNYPSSAAVVDRLLAGEDVPVEERAEKRVEPGDIVHDLPEHSVPALLEKGYIRELAHKERADGG